MSVILIINGPNLNLLGTRETDVYGTVPFNDYLDVLRKQFSGHKIKYFQSNVEGELINAIQNANGEVDGIVLNAAGYSHTSVAIPDAVAAIDVPVIGVHISNIYKREDVRHVDLLAGKCEACLFGFGLQGYDMAIRHLIS